MTQKCGECKHQQSQHLICKFCGISVCSAEYCLCITRIPKLEHSLKAKIAGHNAAEKYAKRETPHDKS